ncbi:MAG TPA: LptF/LptG family permease [Patescibacteria group bacterium]|nr:LptF/LptG family permease [Patescibacteria group bacterium]
MNLIDRYIIRQFVSTLLFSLLALCAIFLVVNLMENLDDFLDNNTPADVIIRYYLYFYPEILKLIVPISMLLTSLFSIGRMTGLNEITAMKTGGLSLYRLMLPLLILATAISFGQVYFSGWVAPKANKSKLDIERRYLNKGSASGPLYNLYLRDEPLRNVIMQYYDGERKTGAGVAIEEYNSETSPRLMRRIDAQEIRWDSAADKWKLLKAMEHAYVDSNVIVRAFDTTDAPLHITHAQIVQLQKQPTELNFDELHEYINTLQQGGKDVRRQRIDYYGQYALPFASLIVVMFGVAFASVKKKSGLAVEIATAMVVCFAYLAFTKISQTVGYSMDLDPIWVGWSANILFFAIGLINLVRSKT